MFSGGDITLSGEMWLWGVGLPAGLGCVGPSMGRFAQTILLHGKSFGMLSMIPWAMA
jgi:hypothetical protein